MGAFREACERAADGAPFELPPGAVERPGLVLAFDLNGMVHRAFHGQPYAAARLALGWAGRIMRTHRPAYVVAAIDRPFPTFRHDLSSLYKSKGRITGEERARVLAQLTQAEELFDDVLGVRTLWARGFEADDALATIARVAEEHGLACLVATKDKDLAQLVNDRTRLLDFATGEIIDRAAVVRRFGVPPEKMADYLALVGDATDCYPGCPGIGPKAAVEILGSFATAQAACEYATACPSSAPEIAGTALARGTIRKKLAKGFEAMRFSRVLATLRRDVPIEVNLEELRALPVPDEIGE